MRYSFVAIALAGCAYQPGSFAFPQDKFPGQRATVGCFDISVERRPDLPIGPVLGYQFANRCDHLATVDLGKVAVVGRNAQGTDVTLRPYDPRAELHPVALDGRNMGAESLAYPADRAMLQVCVDVATLVHRGPRLESRAPRIDDTGALIGRAAQARSDYTESRGLWIIDLDPRDHV